MTRSTPLRRMILHRSHRRTTEAATFIALRFLFHRPIVSPNAVRLGLRSATHRAGAMTHGYDAWQRHPPERLVYHSGQPLRQDFRLISGDNDRVLEVRRKRAIPRHDGPFVGKHFGFVTTDIDHRLDG